VSNVLYRYMALPAACVLDARVPKKTLVSNADLTAADKRAISDDIEAIVWRFALKPDTILVRRYVDDEREYLEVAILEATLRSRRRCRRMAEVIQRAIPYPVLLVLKHEDGVALSAAHKRFSRAERGAIVAEDILLTDWIEEDAPSEAQRMFLESLDSSTLPSTDLLAFYAGVVERLVALAAARLSGEYRLGSAPDGGQDRRERLMECEAVESEIVERRAAIKTESQFNRKVELNTQIKQLEERLAALANRL